MNRAVAILIAVATLIGSACCCCGNGVGWQRPTEPIIGPIIEPVLNTPTPQPTVVIPREPVGDVGIETQELLKTTDVPVRDLHELAIRLRGLPVDTPRTINPEGSPDYPVGARRIFHVSDVDTDEQFDVEAVLEAKTEHVYMWVEDGAAFNRDDLAAAAELFESSTYPTNREFFGTEWTPGVDNDPHLTILHARGLGNSVAGYYSSADEFVSLVREDSNEMEMFYINIDNTTINSSFYNGVLAHEFQHMIHWYNDRNEETWLNEGFSELAMFLNGFDVGGSDWSFARSPDTQLNSWPEGPGAAGPNYGAGYLFTAYFLGRFGPEATKALVANPENGLRSVDDVLSEMGVPGDHEDLFADWVVANLLDDPGLDDGRYGYADINPPEFDIVESYNQSAYPVDVSSTVHQYGTDYIEFRGNRPLSFTFTGATQVGLVDTTARSGDYIWWSNRGDDSNMWLSQEFDLTDVDEATLTYWTWYDLEEDWDYAYVEVSTDGGRTWTILTTPSGTGTNPNGNSFGWAYTGASGGATSQWIQESVDLSPYAGQAIIIRFESITDDAVNRPGFVLDDIAIPEIGYFSDFENDAGGWTPAGFIRHANTLPQRWLVQLVLFGRETTVQRLGLNADQTGAWGIPLDSTASRAIVTISGLAPTTTEWATYQYRVDTTE
ncbi:MAG: hypothetical protein GX620_03575 [Chloroflexi bacterium]|nr:hypothetical protein [Chloroflexota bacterium]